LSGFRSRCTMPWRGRRTAGGDLVDDIDDGVERQTPLPREALRQAVAREVLHDQVLGAVGSGVVVDHLNDVGVLQERRDAGFSIELRETLRALRKPRRQDLDRVTTRPGGRGWPRRRRPFPLPPPVEATGRCHPGSALPSSHSPPAQTIYGSNRPPGTGLIGDLIHSKE
jgi:hypothetical protein